MRKFITSGAGILIVVATFLFVGPSVAFGDSVYSDCDISDLGSNGPFQEGCYSNDFPDTLYGVRIWTKVFPANNGSSGVLRILNQASQTICSATTTIIGLDLHFVWVDFGACDVSSATSFSYALAVVNGYAFGGAFGGQDSDMLWYWSNDSWDDRDDTRFISVLPEYNATTTSTSTVGVHMYVNSDDYPDSSDYFLRAKFSLDSYIACTQSGALYDAIETCTGDYAVSDPFVVDYNDLYFGSYFWATSTEHFGTYGKWTVEWQMRKKGVLGLYSSLVMATTSSFIVGTSSPMDLAREAIASTSEARNLELREGIGAILASTTARVRTSCKFFDSSFDMGDCLTLLIYDEQSMSDNIMLLWGIPPVSYAYRTLTIFTDTEATSTLPTLSYTFGTTSALATVGTVSFDPFGALLETGNIVETAVSDQTEQKNIWDIMDPAIYLVVYLTLAFMIIRDLTGIGSDIGSFEEFQDKRRGFKHVSDEAYRYKETLYKMSKRK